MKRGEAAIHRQGLTRDKARLWRHQESNCCGNVLGACKALERVHLTRRFLDAGRFLRFGPKHVGPAQEQKRVRCCIPCIPIFSCNAARGAHISVGLEHAECGGTMPMQPRPRLQQSSRQALGASPPSGDPSSSSCKPAKPPFSHCLCVSYLCVAFLARAALPAHLTEGSRLPSGRQARGNCVDADLVRRVRRRRSAHQPCTAGSAAAADGPCASPPPCGVAQPPPTTHTPPAIRCTHSSACIRGIVWLTLDTRLGCAHGLKVRDASLCHCSRDHNDGAALRLVQHFLQPECAVSHRHVRSSQQQARTHTCALHTQRGCHICACCTHSTLCAS